jgi:hypothetical protein
MKLRVNKNSLRLVLILVVMSLISLETAFAQNNAEDVTGSAQTKTGVSPATGMPRVNDANPDQEKKDADLLNELIQPESVNRSDQTVKEEACSSVTCTSDTTQ